VLCAGCAGTLSANRTRAKPTAVAQSPSPRSILRNRGSKPAGGRHLATRTSGRSRCRLGAGCPIWTEISGFLGFGRSGGRFTGSPQSTNGRDEKPRFCASLSRFCRIICIASACRRFRSEMTSFGYCNRSRSPARSRPGLLEPWVVECVLWCNVSFLGYLPGSRHSDRTVAELCQNSIC
jgi:hypothetical protein